MRHHRAKILWLAVSISVYLIVFEGAFVTAITAIGVGWLMAVRPQ